MRKVLIVGATSAIAEACARRWAAQGAHLHLAARNGQRLEQIAADLRARGAASVGTTVLDLNDLDRHAELLAQAEAGLGGYDTVLIAHGTLPDQAACERDVPTLLTELQTNAISTLALCTRLAQPLEAAGRGTLAVITSVAGDRGRQSNYVYGAAKGAVTLFLQGLRNRLDRRGVHVLTIKPGFVDTPMTAAFPKGPLWARPEQIALGIERAIERHRDVVYLPGFWRWIMLVIRHIPETIFKRLSL